MLKSENADGQLVVGPDLNPMARSYSNTPESGDTSTIWLATESPTVATVVEADPLSILTTTVVSVITSSPWAEML